MTPLPGMVEQLVWTDCTAIVHFVTEFKKDWGVYSTFTGFAHMDTNDAFLPTEVTS